MSQNKFTVPDEVRNLTPNEINKLTSPQLKLALAALIGEDNNKDVTGPIWRFLIYNIHIQGLI